MTAVVGLWGPGAFDSFTDIVDRTIALDAATHSLALVFCPPKAGTIDKVACCPTLVTGDPPAYYVGIVTVDAAGAPTAVAYGGSAIESYDFVAAGIQWITLATPAVVPAGAKVVVAARVWDGAVAPDAANCVTLRRTNWGKGPLGVPRQARNEGVGWLHEPGFTCIAVHYTDGAIYGLACSSLVGTAFDSADNPDERGCVFTLPTAVACHGARVHIQTLGPNTSLTVKLYDAADALLASCDITDEDFITGGTGVNAFDLFFDPVGLVAGATYRLTILATNATATLTLPEFVFDLAASITANVGIPEGARWQKTTRNDGGAWTDDPIGLIPMALWVSDMTFAGAAAGYAAASVG